MLNQAAQSSKFAVLERLVNFFPPEWLLPLQSGEIFQILEQFNRRLRSFAPAIDFDIVRKGGGTKTLPSWRLLLLLQWYQMISIEFSSQINRN